MQMFLIYLLASMLCALQPLQAGHASYRIGVLANRGRAECLARWTPTAEALTQVLREDYQIVPLAFEEIKAAVQNKRVDYIILNTGQYVALEQQYGIQRIATLKNRSQGQDLTIFGSALFVRADRKDVTSFTSVRGKRVMAVEPDSFGGWLATARELKAAGLVAGRDFRLEFGNTQDAPVQAVLAGKADIGIVRTDLLETLAQEGKLDLRRLRVLPPPSLETAGGARFPLLHSTRLYPEWPFAKLEHTSRENAERVLMALLLVRPRSESASGCSVGWTIPLNYQSVHECLMELRYGPYADYGKVTPQEVLRLYWPGFLMGSLTLAAAIATAVHLRRLNRRLGKAMAEVKTLSGLLPICAWCKRIRTERDEWTPVEAYVHEHTEASFTHGICPECQRLMNETQEA